MAVVSLSFDFLGTSPWIMCHRVASDKLFSFTLLFYEYMGYSINSYDGNYPGMLQEVVCNVTVSDVVSRK